MWCLVGVVLVLGLGGSWCSIFDSSCWEASSRKRSVSESLRKSAIGSEAATGESTGSGVAFVQVNLVRGATGDGALGVFSGITGSDTAICSNWLLSLAQRSLRRTLARICCARHCSLSSWLRLSSTPLKAICRRRSRWLKLPISAESKPLSVVALLLRFQRQPTSGLSVASVWEKRQLGERLMSRRGEKSTLSSKLGLCLCGGVLSRSDVIPTTAEELGEPGVSRDTLTLCPVRTLCGEAINKGLFYGYS